MLAEKRIETKRSKIKRGMELNCLDTGTLYKGETFDVSDGGLKAHLDGAPAPGSNVMVKLFWDDVQKPVESFGTVAWTTPLPAGKGLDVGLMLGIDPPEHKPLKRPESLKKSRHNEELSFKKTVARLPVFKDASSDQTQKRVDLKIGKKLNVYLEGFTRRAMIENVGNIENNGSVNITFKLLDFTPSKKNKIHTRTQNSINDQLNKQTGLKQDTKVPVQKNNTNCDQTDDIDVSQWKKTPFDDVKKLFLVYIWPIIKKAAPVFYVITTFFKTFSKMIIKGTKPFWIKIPVQQRARFLNIKDHLVLFSKNIAGFSKNQIDKIYGRSN